MSTFGSPKGGCVDSDQDRTDAMTGAALFAILWDAIADLLGPATAAALLRRAALKAAPRCPELDQLSFIREDGGYRYEVAAAWKAGSRPRAPLALRELMAELRPLLVSLTGQVVVRHLDQTPPLKGRGL
jgi:hypothetical protein